MIKLVVIVMLTWGSSAFADLSSGDDTLDSKLAEISSRATQLNREFSTLRLRPVSTPRDADIAEQTLQELNTLDTVLHDPSIVPGNMLMNLACAKAYCFGD